MGHQKWSKTIKVDPAERDDIIKLLTTGQPMPMVRPGQDVARTGQGGNPKKKRLTPSPQRTYLNLERGSLKRSHDNALSPPEPYEFDGQMQHVVEDYGEAEEIWIPQRFKCIPRSGKITYQDPKDQSWNLEGVSIYAMDDADGAMVVLDNITMVNGRVFRDDVSMQIKVKEHDRERIIKLLTDEYGTLKGPPGPRIRPRSPTERRLANQ